MYKSLDIIAKYSPQLKDYYSCKHPSLQIFGEEEDDTACLVLYPPAPLHIKLGRDHEVYILCVPVLLLFTKCDRQTKKNVTDIDKKFPD